MSMYLGKTFRGRTEGNPSRLQPQANISHPFVLQVLLLCHVLWDFQLVFSLFISITDALNFLRLC